MFVKKVPSYLFFAILCFGFGSAIFNIALIIDIPAYHDSPILHYGAYRMLHGDLPYRDFFDTNFPATYLIHWLIWILFGSSDFGILFFDMLAMLSFRVFLFLLLGKDFWKESLLICCIVLNLHYTINAQLFLERDIIMFPFLMGGAYFAYRAALSAKKQHFIYFGACIAFAMFIKPLALLLALLFFVANARIYGVRGAAYTCCGAFLVGIPFLVLMALTHSLVPFIEMGQQFLEDYSGWQSPSFTFLPLLYKAILVPAALFLVALFFATRSKETSQRFLALGILMAYSMLHFILQKGWFYQVYFSILLYGIVRLYALFFFSRKIGLHCAWPALIVLPFLYNYSPLKRALDLEIVKQVTSETQRDVTSAKQAFITLHKTKPHTILALDFSTNVHRAAYQSGLKPVSNMIYNYCFYNEQLGNDFLNKACSKFYDALHTSKPDIVIYSRSAWPLQNADAKQLARNNPRFQAFITADYVFFRERKNYIIFMRKKAS